MDLESAVFERNPWERAEFSYLAIEGFSATFNTTLIYYND